MPVETSSMASEDDCSPEHEGNNHCIEKGVKKPPELSCYHVGRKSNGAACLRMITVAATPVRQHPRPPWIT
ncbi:hypothetical protein RB195_025041 [Necator americanus]|uniref:Uncharacterized protein n=1 Tax=Necator americanus TaxID=51031 RepID=A0ABR1EQQ1_NECAM